MTKALVLAMSIHHYRAFCKKFKLNPQEYYYVRGHWDADEVRGYWIDMPIILLENYMRNRNYSITLGHYIGCRFENIGFISEGEMREDEEVPIQYCTKS